VGQFGFPQARFGNAIREIIEHDHRQR
jgi:hypothetical protein